MQKGAAAGRRGERGFSQAKPVPERVRASWKEEICYEFGAQQSGFKGIHLKEAKVPWENLKVALSYSLL